MAFETRGNKKYYYRKRRSGGRVVSEYVGAGELAELCAKMDRIEKSQNAHDRLKKIESRAEFERTDDEINSVF